MVKLIGLAVAFAGSILLLVSGWTKNGGVFGISSIVGIPAIMFGLKMLLG